MQVGVFGAVHNCRRPGLVEHIGNVHPAPSHPVGQEHVSDPVQIPPFSHARVHTAVIDRIALLPVSTIKSFTKLDKSFVPNATATPHGAENDARSVGAPSENPQPEIKGEEGLPAIVDTLTASEGMAGAATEKVR